MKLWYLGTENEERKEAITAVAEAIKSIEGQVKELRNSRFAQAWPTTLTRVCDETERMIIKLQSLKDALENGSPLK